VDTDVDTDEVISGDVLAALQHAELKEMGIASVGHRLSILKAVYEVKIKQNVPIDADDYVPLCMRCLPVVCSLLIW
jgi:hypothetical protein